MNKNILCVDDEPHILEAFKRIFRKEFKVYVAEGGEQAVAALKNGADFAVIVSDMRMPGMSGIEFLNRAKEIAPDSVRIMLTGDSEQTTAMHAINEGEIFRFLTKPCSPEAFAKAVNAGIRQYALVTAEKELLEETLGKSLQVLVDILAMVNPTAFSRASRVKRLARQIAERLDIENLWEIEIAAMLSQIGCVAVPEEVLRKIADGKPLRGEELRLYQQHPQIGRSLIADIPRMATVAEIIGCQNGRVSDETNGETEIPNTARNCAHVLKVALDFDKMLEFGKSPHEAFAELETREDWYDFPALLVLQKIINEKFEQYAAETIDVSRLEFGMIIDEQISVDDVVLIEKGTELSFSMLMKLGKLAENNRVAKQIAVKIPISRSREDTFSRLVSDAKEEFAVFV